jgi:2-polyprenyl-3-methyl-5-hydroxy-6-metoxy-1,4-benzoquinol methylase
MYIPPELRCTAHSSSLVADREEIKDSLALICRDGCCIPIINGIPRFVTSDNYASSFGLQWNTFHKTQLDSYTGTAISRDRLTRCLGGSLEIVKGKSVLEIGCGAGRFTELLLSADARVFACDLSEAVEANYANCERWPDYFVCQASILQLPVLRASFDIVVCLGVIQHTPDPERTISILSEYLKPNGLLVMDHYTYGFSQNLTQKILRQLLIRISPALSKRIIFSLAKVLLPVHKMLWIKRRGLGRIRNYLRKISPLVDYFDSYPQLEKELLSQWAILYTHDTLTDYYKHLRSVEEIKDCLASCGLIEVEVSYGGNGVEARAKRPGASSKRQMCEIGGV